MKDGNNKHLEFFKKLNEVSGDIVAAYESDNDKDLESAMGRFVMLMMAAQDLNK